MASRGDLNTAMDTNAVQELYQRIDAALAERNTAALITVQKLIDEACISRAITNETRMRLVQYIAENLKTWFDNDLHKKKGAKE